MRIWTVAGIGLLAVLAPAISGAALDDPPLYRPAGYVPLSIEEYGQARTAMLNMSDADFEAWKAQHLKTPEQVIQKYWSVIVRESREFNVPPELVAGLLLNEMRALMNEDFKNDLMYFTPAWHYGGPLGLGLKEDYPSIGICQIRVDTIIKRGLQKEVWKGKDGEFIASLGFPINTTMTSLTYDQAYTLASTLTVPETAIRFEAAHAGQMLNLIRNTTWGLPGPAGQPVPIPGAGIIDPSRLSDSQLQLLAEQLVARGFTGVSVDQMKQNIRDGSMLSCLVSSMIDGYWEDSMPKGVTGCAPFSFRVAWGMGVAESVKDVKRYLLPSNPDWNGFLNSRRIYDEQGFYGPKGAVRRVADLPGMPPAADPGGQARESMVPSRAADAPVPASTPTPGPDGLQQGMAPGLRRGSMGFTPFPVGGFGNSAWGLPAGFADAYAFQTDLAKKGIDINVTCSSMTSGTLTCSNTTSEPIAIDLPAGTLLLCRLGDGQVVAIVTDFHLDVPRAIGINIRGCSQLEPGRAQGRVTLMCMEMHKPEPSPEMKYVIARAPDRNLFEIGRITSPARFLGAWTQALFWSYTDGATLDQINKRLAPPVTPREYLQNLYTLSRVGALDLGRKDLPAMMNPALLEEAADPEMARWYARALAVVTPRELARYVEGRKDWLSSAASEGAASPRLRNASAALCVMLASRDPAVRAAAMRAMNNPGPGVKSALVELGTTTALLLPVGSLNEQEVLSALDLAASYGERALKPEIAELAEKGRTPKVKSRAREVARMLP